MTTDEMRRTFTRRLRPVRLLAWPVIFVEVALYGRTWPVHLTQAVVGAGCCAYISLYWAPRSQVRPLPMRPVPAVFVLGLELGCAAVLAAGNVDSLGAKIVLALGAAVISAHPVWIYRFIPLAFVTVFGLSAGTVARGGGLGYGPQVVIITAVVVLASWMIWHVVDATHPVAHPAVTRAHRAGVIVPRDLDGLPDHHLLTTGEAAIHLDTDRYTVRRWIMRGELPGRRIGNRWMTTVGDVREFNLAQEE